MRRLVCLLLIGISACGGALQSPALPPTWALPPDDLCTSYRGPVAIATVEDERLREVSGIVRSRQHEGVTWMHNDSGDGAVLYAVGADGRTTAAFNLGTLTLDPEDLAIGPGPGAGEYLYFADIGDNFTFRPVVSVYRVPEPDPYGTTIGPVERIDLVYPDGPADAEALAVDPVTGGLMVVTKVTEGPAAVLWADAGGLVDGEAVALEEIARLDLGASVTAGDISANGDRLVLRGYENVWMWGRSSLDFAEVLLAAPCELDSPPERQGEAIAFGPGGALYTVSEGQGPGIYEMSNR